MKVGHFVGQARYWKNVECVRDSWIIDSINLEVLHRERCST